ncbi:MAG: AAA family ATPase [Acidimicrobiales bacterium]
MKIAVAGKTGAGKTTVSALLCLALADRGRRVLAVDTDPNPNLSLSLGVDMDVAAQVRAVPRVLVSGLAGGGVTAAQLVSGYGVVTPSGVTLLHAMAMSDEAAGCGCPAHASARSVFGSAAAEQADVTVIDLEGGLEHLDRPSGTLAHVDHLLVVTEASRKSLLSAGHTIGLARAHGIDQVVVVGNKARTADDDGAAFATFAADHTAAPAIVVGWSTEVFEADRAGTGLHLWPGTIADGAAALVAAASSD